METETVLLNKKNGWALLDQLAAAFFATCNPGVSCPAPFSSVIDSQIRNQINRWIEMQDKTLLQTVLSGLLQQFTIAPLVMPVQEAYKTKRLQKIFDYVHRHYNEEIRLPELALEIGMSESALSRFFKSSTGERFIDYVKKVRIEYAARQLLETNDFIKEIGYGCGFNNINYFIRLFKEVKGCTPGKFRQGSSAKNE